MPYLRTYKVFISHAWTYSDDYYRVADFLNESSLFAWENLSVPQHDPIADDANLKYELRNQMRPADVFLIIAGMYVAHSEWIGFELNFARWIGRPIIGIDKFGSLVTPRAISSVAKETVGWRSASIIRAIREHALPSGPGKIV